MSLHTINSEQRLPLGIQAAWAFLSDPHNLAKITPSHMGFEITSPTGQQTYAGQIITYNVRPLLGLTLTWVSEITQCRAPNFFVDEQRFGPYRFWHHQHSLEAVNQQTTLMRDMIHYALPFDLPGSPIDRLVVKPKLKAIFAYREQALKKLFPAKR